MMHAYQWRKSAGVSIEACTFHELYCRAESPFFFKCHAYVQCLCKYASSCMSRSFFSRSFHPLFELNNFGCFILCRDWAALRAINSCYWWRSSHTRSLFAATRGQIFLTIRLSPNSKPSGKAFKLKCRMQCCWKPDHSEWVLCMVRLKELYFATQHQAEVLPITLWNFSRSTSWEMSLRMKKQQ